MDALLVADSTLELLTRAEQWAPSPEQAAAFALEQAAAPTTPVSKGAGVATIPVTGLLTPAPSLSALILLGGFTVYGRLQAAIRAADADPSVSSITLDFDTPGGHVHGLFETIATIEGTRKPITARVRNAQSAGYALAAATRRIEATSPASMVGSIGVAVSYLQDPRVVTLTSTHAPDKRPDLSTEAGKATVRRHLDAVHELFVEAIARGRKTTTASVNAEYGRGATLLAREGASKGMVDAILTDSQSTTTATASTTTATGGDIGDTVADLMTARRKFRTPGADEALAVVERLNAATAAPAPQVGAPRCTVSAAEVVALMEQKRRGALPKKEA